MLISFNYLLLYAVVIVPFVLISLQEEIETVEVDGQEVSCEVDPDACDEKREQNRVDFNNFVLIINAGVLVYSMICEGVIILNSLKPTNTHCNSYLLC